MAGEVLLDVQNSFAVSNKWIADIALSKISPANNNDTSLKADFSIPDINIGTTSLAYKSITVEIPTKVIQPDNRHITFKYMLDIEWNNYFGLYQWTNLIGATENILPTTTTIINAEYKDKLKAVPINVFLLNEYKKPIMKICYNNCWIKQFSELSLSYQDDPNPIKHSFTCNYTDFKLEKINH